MKLADHTYIYHLPHVNNGKPYRVTVNFKGDKYHVGYFKNFKEAKEARDEKLKELKLHAKFQYDGDLPKLKSRLEYILQLIQEVQIQNDKLPKTYLHMLFLAKNWINKLLFKLY